MLRARAAAFLTVLVCATCAAPAAAAPFGPEEETYYREALVYWGLPEPVGCDLRRELVPALPNELVGRVEGCSMEVLEGLRPCETRTVVFHETGHLVGLEHSPDPESLMYAGGDGATFCFRGSVTPLRFQQGRTLRAKDALPRRGKKRSCMKLVEPYTKETSG